MLPVLVAKRKKGSASAPPFPLTHQIVKISSQSLTP